jgi:hypothetical protein
MQQLVPLHNGNNGINATYTTGEDPVILGIEAVILMLTTSSPGGSYSNWWCFIFNADLALSVAMTTVSSIASVFMLPLNLAIYLNATGADGIDIEYGPLTIAVAVVVFGIGFGLFVSRQFPSKRHVFHTSANLAGLSLIALGMASTSGSNEGLFNQPWEFFAGVAAPCIIGLISSFLTSRAIGLTKPQCVSVGIETCYQNTALALSVALASPSPARAAAVPVFYQAVQVVCLGFFSLVSWKTGWTYAPADISLWRMLATNYQPFFMKETELVTKELEKTKRLVKAAEQNNSAVKNLALSGGGGGGGGSRMAALELASPSPIGAMGAMGAMAAGTAATPPGTPNRAEGEILPLHGIVPGGGGGGGETFATPRSSLGMPPSLGTPPTRRSSESPSSTPTQPPGSRPGSLTSTPFATPQGQIQEGWQWQGQASDTAFRTPGGRGLGLGLGDIEEEAVAAVAAGTDAAGSPLVMSPEDMEGGVAPLRQRMKALEELKIRLTRRSTRRISYRDFVTMLSGAGASMSGVIAAAARIPARVSETVGETMKPMQRRLSETMNSMGSSLNLTLKGLTRGSPLPSPAREKDETLTRDTSGAHLATSSNKVAPSPLTVSRSLEALHTAGDPLHEDYGDGGGGGAGALATGSGEAAGQGQAHVLVRRRNSEGSLHGGSSSGGSGSGFTLEGQRVVEGGRMLNFQTPTGRSSQGGLGRSSQGSVGSRGSSGGRSSGGRSSDGGRGDGGGGGAGGRPPRHHAAGTVAAAPGVGRESLPGAPGVGARREVLSPLSNRPPVPDPV